MVVFDFLGRNQSFQIGEWKQTKAVIGQLNYQLERIHFEIEFKLEIETKMKLCLYNVLSENKKFYQAES
jgi:hypothetical protein